MRLLTGIFFTITVLAAVPSYASELTILDCTGGVKAIENIDGNSLSLVEVVLNETVSQLNLESNIGENLTAPVVRNSSRFSAVAPGRWTLCNQEKEYVEFSISKISQSSTGTGVQVSNAFLGGSAIAAITTAALVAGSSSSSSDSSSLSGSFDGSLQEAEVPTLPQPAVSFDEADYPIGAPAKPVSPFN